jgi:putative redox protein
MVPIAVSYQGELHCLAIHGPSRSELPTDAPQDNHGRGEAFSPTDLMAAAFGTCLLTTMAIVGQHRGIDLTDATANMEKHMSEDRPRRVVRLVARIRVPLPPDHPDRASLEAAALGCPVHRSLDPDMVKEVTFEWLGNSGNT